MTLSSPEYLFTVLGIVIIYYLSPHKLRWLIILAASYYLYLNWNPNFIILLIILTILNYIIAHQINRTEDTTHRKAYLAISICINLGVLLFFKYVNNIRFMLFASGGDLIGGSPMIY